MELLAYIQILDRRKWIIALTTLVTVAVTAVGSALIPPTYTATTTLRVLSTTGSSIEYAEYLYAERLMETYTEIAKSGPVLDELKQRLALDTLPAIEVESVLGTELLRISVESRNAILARESANALAEILIAHNQRLYSGNGKSAQEILSEQLTQIESELSEMRAEYEHSDESERIAALSRAITLKEQTYSMVLNQYEQARISEAMRASTISAVEPASIPKAPSKPRKKLNAALGGIVGLMGGLILTFVFEVLDTRLHSTAQVLAVVDLPLLGSIPTLKRPWSREAQPPTLFNNGVHREAYRRLRTNVLALSREPSSSTLLLTSAEPGEGKSTVVANLALTLAELGRRVVVVDADLRHPMQQMIFSLPNKVGLCSVIAGQVPIREVLQESEHSGVWVLTSGPLPELPTELLTSPAMSVLIEQLEEEFDFILMDTPALVAVDDAIVLASVTGEVILVVGRSQAHQEAVEAVLDQLARVKVALTGVIVNRAEDKAGYYL